MQPVGPIYMVLRNTVVVLVPGEVDATRVMLLLLLLFCAFARCARLLVSCARIVRTATTTAVERFGFCQQRTGDKGYS